MKNLTTTQIKSVRALPKIYLTPRLHGNTKYVHGLPINIYLSIILKRTERSLRRSEIGKETDVQTFRRLLMHSMDCINTSYFKLMIEGNNNIYYASPEYGHSDYNKSRIWPNNERGRKLMNLFNSLIYKKSKHDERIKSRVQNNKGI